MRRIEHTTAFRRDYKRERAGEAFEHTSRAGRRAPRSRRTSSCREPRTADRQTASAPPADELEIDLLAYWRILRCRRNDGPPTTAPQPRGKLSIMSPRIALDRDALANLCRTYFVQRLSLFGS